MSASNDYPPMKRIIQDTPSEAETTVSTSSLFSAICKPAYAARLTEIIAERQATVFSTTYCPYCTKAKKLLDKNDV